MRTGAEVLEGGGGGGGYSESTYMEYLVASYPSMTGGG